MRILSRSWAKKVISYVEAQSTGRVGEYRFRSGGQTTLSASCLAAMTLHYLGALESYSAEIKRQWINYINSHQQKDSGLFFGPEITEGELTSAAHTPEHLAMHLTAHVLPALDVLRGTPKYPLHFAHRFLDTNILRKWLEDRDWHLAWLEGNNLLFVGQFLVYMAEHEKKPQGRPGLDYLLEWLDAKQDPMTGVWGTDGYCDKYTAVYGAYHQLLLYYYCGREVKYKERLIDTVLSLQHPDGGFTRTRGGGTCANIDAVDILVNMCKQTAYRRAEILLALRKVLRNIVIKQTPEGGFLNRWGQPGDHMGMGRTRTPANVADMLSTWFFVHAILLIAEVLPVVALPESSRRFNGSCSMGWHRHCDTDFWQRLGVGTRARHKLQISVWSVKELFAGQLAHLRPFAAVLVKRGGAMLLRMLLRRVPQNTRAAFILKLLTPFLESLSSQDQVSFLTQMETKIIEDLRRRREALAKKQASPGEQGHLRQGEPAVALKARLSERSLDQQGFQA